MKISNSDHIYICVHVHAHVSCAHINVLRHINITGYLHLDKIKVEKLITYKGPKLNKTVD
jgi:hypothetical protein